MIVEVSDLEDGVKSLPDETDQVYNEFPNFSLGGIELLDKEVELKDNVWEKVVEVMATIEIETRIEEENVETIDIDDVIPDMYLKRQKKPRVLHQSLWVSEFDSTSGTKKRVVKGMFAFPVVLAFRWRMMLIGALV
ncbi:Hypothetical predicted protein [Olea europaea subsp. europaea]|uniref:Uncharacterized protein n=1 Tax=Olea europaea subsp. europaea TaxID=158383 RepID=A0A8S0RRE5_OLEEU|nr:Hypothetical predicted protein [Olea europaea subsp. europaea]